MAESDNPISKYWQKYRDLDIPPVIEGAMLIPLVYGITRLGHNTIIDTGVSLMHPALKAAGMSPEDIAHATNSLKYDKSLKRWIPIVAASTVVAGHAGINYRPNEQYGGYFSRNAAPKVYAPADSYKWKMHKTSSFGPGGFTSFDNINMQRRVNANNTINLFQGDPHMPTYAQNFGTAIVANAAGHAGVSNPTLGNIFDSAVDKIKDKLTFGGVVDAAASSIIANAGARLFTGALDSMIGLPRNVQQNIVSAGTWAGAISSILS